MNKLAFILAAAIGTSASAATTFWNKDASGQFGDPANWFNGVPDADDVAGFRRGAGVAYTVTMVGTTPAQGGVNYVNQRLEIGSNEVTLTRSPRATYTL